MLLHLQKFSFRLAEQVLNSKLALKQEIEDILTDPSIDIRSLSRPKFYEILREEFIERGWEYKPSVLGKPNDPVAKLDFLKERIGVEVNFGHRSFIGTDLLKFQAVSDSSVDKIDAGIYIVTTDNFQTEMKKTCGQNWEGSLTFEMALRYLRDFKNTIHLPIYVLGIDSSTVQEPTKSNAYTKSSLVRKAVNAVTGLQNHQPTTNKGEEKENAKTWDLFICHASEDKDEIVRPLVKILVETGYRVWYDEFELKLGDSLRRSIDKGLAYSSYGLVILSPNFFAKEWPQRELDGLAARESKGKKVILPVWHNVDGTYVRKFSPTLADLFAASTSDGIDSIVKEVQRVLKPSSLQVSVRSRLESTLDYVRGKDEQTIARIVKEDGFDEIKQTFKAVLDGIAFFNLPNPQAPEVDKTLFYFLESAIMERNENEGAALFEYLLDWYFQTVTPSSRLEILKILARLIRLPYIREIISRSGQVASFIADFGISKSFKSAGISAEILYGIQSLLSEADLNQIVNYAIANAQIRGSWEANKHLEKMLSSLETKFGKTKIEGLRKRLE